MFILWFSATRPIAGRVSRIAYVCMARARERASDRFARPRDEQTLCKSFPHLFPPSRRTRPSFPAMPGKKAVVLHAFNFKCATWLDAETHKLQFAYDPSFFVAKSVLLLLDFSFCSTQFCYFIISPFTYSRQFWIIYKFISYISRRK